MGPMDTDGHGHDFEMYARDGHGQLVHGHGISSATLSINTTQIDILTSISFLAFNIENKNTRCLN